MSAAPIIDTDPAGRAASATQVWLLRSLLTTLLGFQFWLAVSRPLWTSATLMVLSVTIVLIGAAATLTLGRIDALSFLGVYTLYLVLSHLGVPFVDLFVESPLAHMPSYSTSWYASSDSDHALVISSLGVVALLLGASLTLRSGIRLRGSWPPLDERGHRLILQTGVALLAFSGVFVVWAVFTGRLPLFVSYVVYREAMEVLPSYPWFVFAFATGLPFVLATGNRRDIHRALILFGLVALFFFQTGSRSEVLFPAAAGIGVLRARGYTVSRTALIAGLLTFFLLIPAIRQLRLLSGSERTLEALSITIADPLVEIGFTLRPVATTVGWIEDGEATARGGTYLLAFQRLAGILPLIDRPDLANNPFFFGERLRGYGYSVVAEAYYNFGTAGVAVILGLLGAFFGGLLRASGTSLQLAFFGALFAVLINSLRNSFLFVPGQVFMVSCLVLAAWILARSTPRRRRRPSSPPRRDSKGSRGSKGGLR